MHPHETLLRRLFECIAARDAAGVVDCYHPDVFFTDPLYPRLHGAQAAAFWEMVFAEATDWRFELHDLAADADGGRAEWTARYGLRGREIETQGRSLFAFRDGRVCRHYDHFSLWRWAGSVLGPAGLAAGWFGPFRWALRQRLARRLERW